MRIIVLFNLKPGVEASAYEEWARSRHVPAVRSLPSVDDFTILRTTGRLGQGGDAPYDYVEIVEVADMDGFATDAASDAVQAVNEEFTQWSDDAVTMTTEELGLG